MRVRRAGLNDLDPVYEIERMSFKDPYPKPLLLYLMILHPDSFLVAEVNGEVVGYAVGALMKRRGHVLSLAVHPSHRRKGVGSRLMEALEEVFKSKEAREVELEVREDNVEARMFYEKLGYRSVGRLRHYYSNGSDAIAYRKEVKDR